MPDTDQWRFETPEIATRDPLMIEFDRPFDLSLAQSSIYVLDENAQLVTGAVSLNNNETVWQFHPENAWESASLHIVVDARLEDVAGNNFRELLDHSVETKAQRIDQKTVILNLNSAAE